MADTIIQPQEATEGLRLSDYRYELPRHLIAKYPLEKRDAARMMVLRRDGETIEHRQFSELPELLSPNDLVVMNNTQVLPARFFGLRQDAEGTVHPGKVEVLLLHPEEGDDTRWLVMMRPAKKLKPGTCIQIADCPAHFEIVDNEGRGRGLVQIHLNGVENVIGLMQRWGQMPIPPYLDRDAEELDKTVYQTVFARVPGAQAAPTAGLHFTPEVLSRLSRNNIGTAEVTLSVSAGTFRSVEDDDITQHRMDPEQYTLPQGTVEAIEQTKASGGKVVAIGTTTCKTLETVAHKYSGSLQPDIDWSRLFIYPGFQFQVTDALLTNFHLPETTLLMLISAFSNREFILRAYEEAIQQEYRFFSYGDCMLIL